MSAQYEAVPDGSEEPPSHSYPPRGGFRASLDSQVSAASGSDIVYRDALDTDPFTKEKEAGFRDDASDLEEEEETGYVVESRRVSCGLEVADM